jgi:hypothetical protein
MEKNNDICSAIRDCYGLCARDAENEPDLAHQAERKFHEIVQSYTSQTASPVYLMEVVDKARSAAQYRKDYEGVKASHLTLEFIPTGPNAHAGMP